MALKPINEETQTGFSLIELIVALAVFAILVQAAVPMFTAGLGSLRAHAASERLMDDLMWAQSTAITKNEVLTVTLNGASCQWAISQGPTMLRCMSTSDFTSAYRFVTMTNAGVKFTVNQFGQFSGSSTTRFLSTTSNTAWSLLILGAGKLTIRPS